MVKGMLPYTYFLIWKFFLPNRFFHSFVSDWVPHPLLIPRGPCKGHWGKGSILSPLLYTLYTADTNYFSVYLKHAQNCHLNTRLQIYYTILMPIWADGIELWGSTKPSNYLSTPTLQSKILRRLCHLLRIYLCF